MKLGTGNIQSMQQPTNKMFHENKYWYNLAHISVHLVSGLRFFSVMIFALREHHIDSPPSNYLPGLEHWTEPWKVEIVILQPYAI